MSIGTPVSQGTGSAAAGGTTVSFNTLANMAIGDTLFIQYSVASSSGTGPTVSDGLGNTYSNTDTTGFASKFQWAIVAILTVAIPAGTTITLTQSGVTAAKDIQAISATVPGASIDSGATASDGFRSGSSATWTAPSTLANANSLCIAWGAINSTSITISNSSGWSAAVNTAGSSSGVKATLSYEIVSSTTAPSITQTFGSSVGWSLGIVAISSTATTPTGTGAATLGLTGAGSGVVGVSGTGAATLGLTGAGTGARGATGSGSATLGLTSAGTGSSVKGTGSATLGLAGSGTGAVGVAGTGSATLGLTGSGTGTASAGTVTGTGAATLGLFGSGSGYVLVTGSGTATFSLSASGSGTFTPPTPPTPVPTPTPTPTAASVSLATRLPPVRYAWVYPNGQPQKDFARWAEGVDRAIGTPPDEGSTGTAQNYDVGTQGDKVPLTSGNNIWSGSNTYTKAVSTLVGVKVNNIKVLGAQGAAVADATDAASAISQLNLALAAMRAHGLIAT